MLEAFPKEKPFFRLLIRLEEGQACPLEALITQALSSKIAMKPGDIRDKKELAEELRLAAEKKLSSEAKTETPRQAESGGVMKIMKIVGLIALIVCALNRFFHFLNRGSESAVTALSARQYPDIRRRDGARHRRAAYH